MGKPKGTLTFIPGTSTRCSKLGLFRLRPTHCVYASIDLFNSQNNTFQRRGGQGEGPRGDENPSQSPMTV